MAYPDDYKKFTDHGRLLSDGYSHPGNVEDVQLRGEYLYAALGRGGVRVYDVADVDVKDVSQRVITAPVSPLGQRFYLEDQRRRGHRLAEHAGAGSAAQADS